MAAQYDRLPPGPVALAAFEAALFEAGPDGLSPALLALVHVPGLPKVSMAFRWACIQNLRERGRCVVTHYKSTRNGARPDEMRTCYRHACHVKDRTIQNTENSQ
jgi:hypothetical protein